jgi:hypothetical protein
MKIKHNNNRFNTETARCITHQCDLEIDENGQIYCPQCKKEAEE